jgi:hypothetical protein
MPNAQLERDVLDELLWDESIARPESMSRPVAAKSCCADSPTG